MPKSTTKIIALAASTSILMLVLALVPLASTLRSYLQVVVLGGAILASAAWMGWARVRAHYPLVALLVSLAALVFQLASFLLLGLKLGFSYNTFGWNWSSLLRVFLPMTLLIVAAEILRGQLIEKGRGSLVAVITTGVAIWLVTILIALPSYNLSEPKAIFTFLTVVAGPALLTNILLTYLAYTYGYRINIAYRLIMELPLYLLPVLPDAGVYLSALLRIGFTILLALGFACLHRRSSAVHSLSASQALRASRRKSVRSLRRPETEQAKRVKAALKWSLVGLTSLITLVYISLMSGLFAYRFLAVGSGSMAPNLQRGDLLLVQKSRRYDTMHEGDVLVYRHGDVTMVHRVIAVTEQAGTYTFQTKGDNNPASDNWQVTQDDIIGLARGKIAMLGFPTLWLNELFNSAS